MVSFFLFPGGLSAQETGAIGTEFTSFTDQAYPPKGKYFNILEDHDLKIHQRPIFVLGKLIVRGDARAGVTWKMLQDVTAEFSIKHGADALINMRSSDVNSGGTGREEDPVMWIESELIVYLDKEKYGHLGFWYNNSISGIEGIRIEFVVKGSPAEKAGILPGDILKAVSGEKIGSVNIRTQYDYRDTQFKFRADDEYKLFVERNYRPKVLTIIAKPESEVYDWSQQYGGL
ncbi:MAG: PDZ domain-containing protein [Candidatus Omnitrophota bacterium]